MEAHTLEGRFAAPAGFTRVAVEEGGFGGYLRQLVLAPVGTPVRSYRGEVLHAGDDPRIAAVAALDVSPADLQQCADSIVRLHAEWRWASGRRDASYNAASGAAMPFARWVHGERPVARAGGGLAWVAAARPSRVDHDAYRAWLDAVFAYANTVSLARDAAPVAAEALRPGDFFVHGGWPGHAILVLDVATDAKGGTRALLGQGFMPAQSFHVLRSDDGDPWFALEPGAPVVTPFWPAFAWSELRRLPE